MSPAWLWSAGTKLPIWWPEARFRSMVRRLAHQSGSLLPHSMALRALMGYYLWTDRSFGGYTNPSAPARPHPPGTSLLPPNWLFTRAGT
jgi:hypothetical protein